MLGSIEQSLPLFRKAARHSTTAAGPRGNGSGLSKSHNVTKIHHWGGAGLVKIVNPYNPDGPNPFDRSAFEEKSPVRGEIQGFSAKSQQRSRRQLAKLPDSEINSGFLVTLTYPNEYPEPEKFEHYKNHIRRYGQEVKRQWGGSGLWFLEFQKRGAPHYHLIVMGIDSGSFKEFREWTASTWYRVVGSEDPRHRKAGTSVERPRSAGKARSYLCKYLSKGDQALEGRKVGRYWGYVNRSSIPFAEETVQDLSPEQARRATRIARRAVENRVWVSAWGRLHKRASKHLPELASLSVHEFRSACDHVRKDPGNQVPFRCRSVMLSSLSIYIALSLSCGGRPRFPRRYRTRNNSTIHLFCDASSFMKSLRRLPDWVLLSPDSEGPCETAPSPLVRRIEGRKEVPRGQGSDSSGLRCYRVNDPFPAARRDLDVSIPGRLAGSDASSARSGPPGEDPF